VTGLFIVVCIVVLGTRAESSGFRVPKVAEGNPMMHAEDIIVINNPMHINPVFAASYVVGQWLRKGSRLRWTPKSRPFFVDNKLMSGKVELCVFRSFSFEKGRSFQ
jgi:hypothetical protein